MADLVPGRHLAAGAWAGRGAGHSDDLEEADHDCLTVTDRDCPWASGAKAGLGAAEQRRGALRLADSVAQRKVDVAKRERQTAKEWALVAKADLALVRVLQVLQQQVVEAAAAEEH